MASWVRTTNSPAYETAELVVSGVIPMILISVGTLGNVLSIIILLNKENRRRSTNIYLIFLCAMDTLSLYQWNLTNAVYTFTNGMHSIWERSLFLCKSTQFFSFYTLHSSAMFLTLVELDRTYLLRNGWYKRKVAKAWVAFRFCIVILLVLLALNGFLFGLGFDLTMTDNSTGVQQRIIVCYYSMNANLFNYYANVYPWIHLVVMYCVPFTLMSMCTLLTIKKLFRRQQLITQQQVRNAERNRRISIMLLLMCLTYAICTLPNRLLFSVLVNQIIGHEYTDTVMLASSTLLYTRNAMNIFFLYISVYEFRRDVLVLAKKCRGNIIRNQVQPTGLNEQGTTAAISIIRRLPIPLNAQNL